VIDRIVVWALTLKTRVSEEHGQDLTEYALLTGGIAIMLVTAVGLFSGAFIAWFGAMQEWVAGLSPGGGGS